MPEGQPSSWCSLALRDRTGRAQKYVDTSPFTKIDAAKIHPYRLGAEVSADVCAQVGDDLSADLGAIRHSHYRPRALRRLPA